MGKRDRWASSSDEEEEKEEGVGVGNGDGKRSSSKKIGRSKAKVNVRAERGTTTPATMATQAPAVAGSDPRRPNHHDPSTSSSSSPSFPLHNPLWDGSRRVYDCYERIRKVSEGTYGVVWMGRDVATRETVALKQIKFGVGDSDDANEGSMSSVAAAASATGHKHRLWKEGFPVAALREINVLLSLSHESIVTVKEMVVGDGPEQVYMVMDYYEFDLKVGISNFDGPLFQGELKGIMRQILSATAYLHARWYLHRDLKPSNILVHRSGRIALADFGLARCVFFFQNTVAACGPPLLRVGSRGFP
jgi:serine/threonine protein kinase